MIDSPIVRSGDVSSVVKVLGRNGKSTRPAWGRVLFVAVATVSVVHAVLFLRVNLAGWFGSHLGWDFGYYLDGTRQWLTTGSPYDPRYFTEGYGWFDMAFIHPPIALLLFAPFTILPPILWWAIPLGILGWSAWSYRPSLLGWTLIVAMAALPTTLEKVLFGNSVMWVAAFTALGLRYPVLWALTLVKPTFAPLMLFGIRDRRAWLGGFIVLGACLAFGSLWVEWVRTVQNWEGPTLYTLLDVPFVLIPVVAWLARSTR